MQRLVLISDLHGQLPSQLPEGDILIVAGDLCPWQDHSLDHQRAFIEGPFHDWLSAQPHSHKVGIAGNHDFIAQDEAGSQLLGSLPWHYLHDSGTEIAGLNFWGSPHVLSFADWAFELDEHELQTIWNSIPADADVVITHGPAYGAGDAGSHGPSLGSTSLRQRLIEISPVLHVTGHVHESHGRYEIARTASINASVHGHANQVLDYCWVAEIEKTSSRVSFNQLPIGGWTCGSGGL